jgi:large subunit ribosomal protein L18
MKKVVSRLSLRKKRLPRIRHRLTAAAGRPRFIIIKSNYALTVQVVDDIRHHTILAIRTSGKSLASANMLANEAVKLLKEKKIKSVVFDRAGYKYHGVVRVIAEGIREGGIRI